MSAKNARVDHTGETIGYLRVEHRIGPWRGKRATEYLCESICCGVHEIRMHRLLTEWRADPTQSARTQCPICGKRKGGGAELVRTRHSHEGQTYGYAQVGAMVGGWRDSLSTEYNVHKLCCGVGATMTHTELSRLRRTKPKRCVNCVREDSSMLTARERAAGGCGVVMAEYRERMGLIEARELERQLMLERVRHRRAQADAAMAAHYERLFGRPPSGAPDFTVELSG